MTEPALTEAEAAQLWQAITETVQAQGRAAETRRDTPDADATKKAS